MADLTRRQVLLGSALAAAIPGVGRAQAAGKKLIVVFANGGWDPTFVFEPRLGEPGIDGPEVYEDPDDPLDREAVRTFGDLSVVVNDRKRPAVTAFFEDWAHEALVVNGIWTGSIAHSSATIRMLTGTSDPASPDLAVITGAELGGGLPVGTVDLSGHARPGPLAATMARIGHRGQILALLDPETYAYRSPDGATSPRYLPPVEDEAAVQAWLHARADQLTTHHARDLGRNRSLLDDWRDSQTRARRLEADVGELASVLELGDKPDPLEASVLAVDLLERGVCAATMLDTPVEWDTHTNHAEQHACYQTVFAGLSVVMSELHTRGMLDDTLVVVLSEMIRTPRLEADRGGKGHWPHATALLLGGGIHGGRKVGGYDARLQSLPVDLATGTLDDSGELLTYDRFVAGVLEHLGVSASAWLPNTTPLRGLS